MKMAYSAVLSSKLESGQTINGGECEIMKTLYLVFEWIM